MFKNEYINQWVQEICELVGPKDVVLIDGTKEQLERLKEKACQTGDLIKLNQEKLPGCYLRRTKINDVARVEDRTFICTENPQDVGPTNNWKDSVDAKKELYRIAEKSYKDRTMYIIPFSMGNPKSPFAKFGIEITDSIYVVLSMSIMTRVGAEVLDKIGDRQDWIKGLHCCCDVDPEKRYICHFPNEKMIISVNSEYGGNVLLGKKCFALRIASYLGQKESWLAEHMLILGIQLPNGEIKYIAAAFPSACGKTNLAMLIPPQIYKEKGYKIWCVGDDIAWMHKGEDGRLWAINPENGFFGVAPGTNEKTNFNAMQTTCKDTIFTNVVHNLEDNTVWWEGMNTPAPANAIDWKGNNWNGQDKNNKERGAHPNSRFTSPAQNCPCLSKEFENPNGVPISAIIFGGRRSNTAPLVCQAKNWVNGVFMGATMASETTAAATGKVGVIRRDPMAMLPFCGYDINKYFEHWLSMGQSLGEKAPKIFNVNWFKTDEHNNFIWPGFSENLRVLDWIISRCESEKAAESTAIGYLPRVEDINLKDLDMNREDLKALLEIDKTLWANEVAQIKEFFNTLGENLPEELKQELNNLEKNLEN